MLFAFLWKYVFTSINLLEVLDLVVYDINQLLVPIDPLETVLVFRDLHS